MTESHSAHDRLLDVSLALIRRSGFHATSVADLCAAAGVTKGAFFHHFSSKDELAVAAAQHWSRMTEALCEAASYRMHADPRDRVLGYLAQRRAWLHGPLPEVTCLAGTMVQEVYLTVPSVRDAARDSILAHADVVARDIEAARVKHVPEAAWDARSLSLHIQTVIQGAFILAKATGDITVAERSLDHLTDYVRHLFGISADADTKELKP